MLELEVIIIVVIIFTLFYIPFHFFLQSEGPLKTKLGQPL